MGRHTVWALLGLALLAVSLHGQVNAEAGPSESECRPYIEKAIHELQGDADDGTNKEDETIPTNQNTEETTVDGSSAELQADQPEQAEDSTETENSTEDDENDSGDVVKEVADLDGSAEKEASTEASTDAEEASAEASAEASTDAGEASAEPEASAEASTETEIEEQSADEEVAQADQPAESDEEKAEEESTEDAPAPDDENTVEEVDEKENTETETAEEKDDESNEAAEVTDSVEKTEEAVEDEVETETDTKEDEVDTEEQASAEEPAVEEEIVTESADVVSRTKREIPDEDTVEDTVEDTTEEDTAEEPAEEASAQVESGEKETVEEKEASAEEAVKQETGSTDAEVADSVVHPAAQNGSEDEVTPEVAETAGEALETEETAESGEKSHPEEDLLMEFEIPENLRSRDHITELLHLDEVSSNTENAIHKTADVILKELKKIYDSAIKPLETQYKYRDLSNRHFGDPEIFSKPLVLFMGPWSGGKSTILNYLSDNEYTVNSLRTGAEPSPAYFNILMHGDEPEVLDGTQLAADWTFSGLQKFGEGMLDRLRGLRLPNKLLEKVNIVEIPGILEVRKQVSRSFPFNDACQWFIDRADIIFLVYDPAKLDVGPETEAILDQLKGREYQTRIVLNKADTVKPEELMRVQGALIWNISPLMSSAQPPVMYTVSLRSHPYDIGAPIRLLHAQERALLRDLRGAIDKRIENKIASARRFAVRVRNHAKMVDCYLTTYYNHKTLFGNKKHITEQIITNPQNYHIYEGISTLTNISRYDLPDPDVYRDFFRLNPLYEFKKLVETCTYFNGCPINKLDIAIAYDLPELVGKYKKLLDTNLLTADTTEQAAAKPKS